MSAPVAPPSMALLLGPLFLLLFPALSPGPVLGLDRPEAVDQLYKDFFRFKLGLQPLQASLRGFHEFDGQIPDASTEAREEMHRRCAQFRDRAGEMLQQDQLSTEDKHYLSELSAEAEYCVNGSKYNTHLLIPLSHYEGVQVEIPFFFKRDRLFKLERLEDYEAVFSRLEALPTYLRQLQDRLEEGVRQNMTYSREALDKVKGQFEKLQGVRAEETNFYHPFEKRLSTFSNGPKDKLQIDTLRKRAKDIINKSVLPAYQALYDYLYGEYSKHLRSLPGFVGLPNGKDIYQQCIKFHTTADLSAKDIHQLGLEEMTRIHKQATEAAGKLGFSGMTNQQVFKHLNELPEQSFNSTEVLVNYISTMVNSTIKDAMATVFEDHLVQSPDLLNFVVKPFPEGHTGLAYYNPASKDGKIPGEYRIGLPNVRAFSLRSLTLHEAIPGHHFQGTVSLRTASNIPNFIAVSINFPMESCPTGIPGRNAYKEGWGLYSEYLGKEMKLYEDPLDYLGYLNFNLLRAARLVVDSGIHHYGWSYEKAVDYLVNEALITRESAEGQIVRYIFWPGQATSYKVGEQEIHRMRQEREKKLGEKFDLKKFHTHFLSCKGVVASVETCIRHLENKQKN